MDENKYILIVDDNQANLKLASNSLKKPNYKIALAMDGESALEILEHNKIDLILLDVMMPGIDGFEVCRRIKKDEKLKDIPVIFLTAKNQTEDIVEGFEVGGTDYVTKPFNHNELSMRVSTHLELSHSRRKILEMNKTRDKLYSIIAHDIRSPFSGIIQTVNAIANGYIEPGSEDFMEIINHLKQRTVNTKNLLNNLLAWTKLQSESITLSPSPVQIDVLLSECVQLLYGNASDKNLTLEIDIPDNTTAYCDEVSIHTIFRNLISNAIKFTPQKGNIKIYSTNNNYLNIHIEDTGIGMTKEVIHKIIEESDHHTTSGTENEQGSGLGLIMVNDFVKKNNGKINIESEVNIGTKITVSLPTENTK